MISYGSYLTSAGLSNGTSSTTTTQHVESPSLRMIDATVRTQEVAQQDVASERGSAHGGHETQDEHRGDGGDGGAKAQDEHRGGDIGHKVREEVDKFTADGDEVMKNIVDKGSNGDGSDEDEAHRRGGGDGGSEAQDAHWASIGGLESPEVANKLADQDEVMKDVMAKGSNADDSDEDEADKRGGGDGDDIDEDEAGERGGGDGGREEHLNNRIEDGPDVYMKDIGREKRPEPVLKSSDRITEKRPALELIDKPERPRKRRKQAQVTAVESEEEEEEEAGMEQGRRWVRLEEDIFVSLQLSYSSMALLILVHRLKIHIAILIYRPRLSQS